MKILKLHFHHVRIPLRLTFAQANQNTRLSDSVIVRIQTGDGIIGFGEACPRTYVSGEDVESVRQTIAGWKTHILNTTFEHLDDIRNWAFAQLDQSEGPAAVCAMELALIDAWSKTYQVDLQDALNQIRPLTDLSYAGVIPYGEWTKLEPSLKHFHFRSWKFKAYSDQKLNEQRIIDMQSLWGKDIPIRMDANTAWSLTEAQQQIKSGIVLGVTSYEQPVSKDEDAVTLMNQFSEDAQLMADESLVSYADAERLISTKAYNHFSLKLSKNGGLFNSLKVYNLAREHGIGCQLSAHFGETSILSAAGALFASLVPELSALEGALGTYLLREDICRKPVMVGTDGKLQPAPHYMGWPVKIDELRLNQYSLRTEYWEK